MHALVQKLMQEWEICFDTETTGTDALTAEIVGLSPSSAAHKAWYIPFSEEYNIAKARLEIFRPLFESENVTKIGQNIKYDLTILQNYGIGLKGALYDTMLAHYLIEPDQRHNMDILSETYLGYQPVSITTLIGKKRGQPAEHALR